MTKTLFDYSEYEGKARGKLAGLEDSQRVPIPTSPSRPPSKISKSPEETRIEENSKKLEEKYWETTNEKPRELVRRVEIWLDNHSGKEASKIAILLDLIENGTVNDYRDPRNRGKGKFRLEPMNWHLLAQLALMMKEVME